MFIVSLRLPKVTTLALETPRGFSEVFFFPGLCGVSRVCLGMSGSSLVSRDKQGVEEACCYSVLHSMVMHCTYLLGTVLSAGMQRRSGGSEKSSLLP